MSLSRFGHEREALNLPRGRWGGGGGREWKEGVGDEGWREGWIRETHKCNCDRCFIPHMGPVPSRLAAAIGPAVIVPSV